MSAGCVQLVQLAEPACPLVMLAVKLRSAEPQLRQGAPACCQTLPSGEQEREARGMRERWCTGQPFP